MHFVGVRGSWASLYSRKNHTHTHPHHILQIYVDLEAQRLSICHLLKLDKNPSGMLKPARCSVPKWLCFHRDLDPQVRFDTIHELLIVNSNAFCRHPFPRFLRGSPYTYRILPRIKAILVGEIATFPNLFLLSWKYNNQAPWLELGLYQASSLVAAIVECLTGLDLDSWAREGPWSFNDHLCGTWYAVLPIGSILFVPRCIPILDD